jgi:hypothetical protein
MSSEALKERLARSPAKVECPICRHRQWQAAPEGRCDQCGSEVAIYETREEAAGALDALVARGRLAYLRDAEGGLFAVIANRTFAPRENR